MNGQENQVANKLLTEIDVCARTEPEKAKTLADTYKVLCEAYAVRAKADFEHPEQP